MTPQSSGADTRSGGHTPGPWSAENPLGDDAEDSLWIVEAGKPTYDWRCLASVHAEPGMLGISKRERDANARLIATAPELYEALALLLDSEDFSEDRDHWEEEHRRGNGHAWRVLKAMDALAKARGESSK